MKQTKNERLEDEIQRLRDLINVQNLFLVALVAQRNDEGRQRTVLLDKREFELAKDWTLNVADNDPANRWELVAVPKPPV